MAELAATYGPFAVIAMMLSYAVILLVKNRKNGKWDGTERRTLDDDARDFRQEMRDSHRKLREDVGEIKSDLRLIVYRVDRLEHPERR